MSFETLIRTLPFPWGVVYIKETHSCSALTEVTEKVVKIKHKRCNVANIFLIIDMPETIRRARMST